MPVSFRATPWTSQSSTDHGAVGELDVLTGTCNTNTYWPRDVDTPYCSEYRAVVCVQTGP